MTNYEIIKDLNIKELAGVIMCPNEMGYANIDCDKSDDKNCYQCCLDWLRQEAELL